MFIKATPMSVIMSLLVVVGISYGAQPLHAGVATNLIDFVVLKDGHGIEERNTYEFKMSPIAAKYGAKIIHSYDITSHLSGPLKEAVRVNVWKMPNAAAFKKIGSDSAYQALVASRDLIHDMKKLTLYMGNEIQNNGPIKDGVILVDLVVMKDGYGNKERDVYESKMAPLAAKYGFEIAASYAINKKLGGAGPQRPLRLNLWRVKDPSTMKKLSADADYIALASIRNEIHDFSKLTMFYAQPRS